MLLLACALPARAATVSEAPAIGPATLTFPEIARALSQPGRKIRCDPALRDSAAFVRLRPRPWEQTRDILEQGLGVRFHDKGRGDWEWKPDAALLRQERRWRERYVTLAEATVSRRLEQFSAKYGAFSYRQLSDELAAQMQAHARKAAAEAEAAEARGEVWDLASSLAAVRTPIGVSEIHTFLSPMGWQLLHKPPHTLRLGTLLERGWGVTAGPARQLMLSGWEGANPQETKQWFDTADLFVQSVRFDPYTRSLRPQGWLISPERVFEEARPSPLDLPCDDGLLPSTLGALDREAANTYLRESAATETVLAAPEARRLFTSRASHPDASASHIIESWSHAEDQEAVMVLWPGRELSVGTWGTCFSLRDWYQEDAGTRNVQRQLGFTRAASREDLQQWSQAPAAEHSPWTLERRSGVLLVRNRLAFLDRPHRFPLAAFLKLERVLPRAAAPEEIPSMPFAALSAYVREAAPEKNGEWTGAPHAQYRGVYVQYLSHSQPLLHLVEGLDPATRARLRRRLVAGERLRLPLRRFSLSARLQLIPALRALGPTYPVVWHPRATERLSFCELELWADPHEAGSPQRLLSVALSDFSDGGRRDPATQPKGDALVYWSQGGVSDGAGVPGVIFPEER